MRPFWLVTLKTHLSIFGRRWGSYWTWQITNSSSPQQIIWPQMGIVECIEYGQIVKSCLPFPKMDSGSEEKPVTSDLNTLILSVLGQTWSQQHGLRTAKFYSKHYVSRTARRQTNFKGDCHCLTSESETCLWWEQGPAAQSAQSSLNLGR